MKKQCLKLAVLFVILFLILPGCGRQEEELAVSSNALRIKMVRTGWAWSWLSLDAELIAAIEESMRDLNLDTDYEKYFRKIWTTEPISAYSAPPSFVITEIEKGQIKGLFATADIWVPYTYKLTYDPPNNVGFFSGSINDGKAVCEFSDSSGNKGTLVFRFMGEEGIEVEIDYSSTGNRANGFKLDEQWDGTYQFRPLKLSDWQHKFSEEDEKRWQIELEEWGRVQLVTELNMMEAAHVFPDAYLVDEEENILYRIPMINTGYEHYDSLKFEFYDHDGNGRKDIIVRGQVDTEKISVIYYQMENGWFLHSVGGSSFYNHDSSYYNQGAMLSQRSYVIELYPGKEAKLVYEEHGVDTSQGLKEAPVIYILDEEGKRIYLSAFGPGRIIKHEEDIAVADLNGDGLNDIHISFYNTYDQIQVESTYYQLENGCFLDY
ncbi:MAG: hypothetical protein J1E61_04180 [Lachnospiraceae bacterium]|nr:hypothetical protein [Lachnospiraceae bacterium]